MMKLVRWFLVILAVNNVFGHREISLPYFEKQKLNAFNMYRNTYYYSKLLIAIMYAI